MTKGWVKSDWRARPRVQMPDYPDAAALRAVEARLAKYPPLVFAGEARKLKRALGDVAEGRAFLLQGGDCAESFAEFSADNIRDTFKVMLQMAIVLTWGAKVPVVKVGRVAGQFAKPRSAPTEIVNGIEIASYKGDIINGFDATPEARTPDPDRMLQAYTQAAASLNLLRAFSTGGYADIHRVQSWIAGFTEEDEAKRYREIAIRIQDAMDFMAAAGVTSDTAHSLATVDFYTRVLGFTLRRRAEARAMKVDGKFFGVPGLAHAVDVHPDVLLGHAESATDPRGQHPEVAGLGVGDQPRQGLRPAAGIGLLGQSVERGPQPP